MVTINANGRFDLNEIKTTWYITRPLVKLLNVLVIIYNVMYNTRIAIYIILKLKLNDREKSGRQ